MLDIAKATPDQAESLFEILAKATEVGCAPFYPPEVMAIWHKGRSAEGMRGVISEGEIFSLTSNGGVCGFAHIHSPEIVGLFVHPDHHRKGLGTELFRFGVKTIGVRPILVMATLNAVPFYEKMGCRKISTEVVRRHDHDIYVARMELA